MTNDQHLLDDLARVRASEHLMQEESHLKAMYGEERGARLAAMYIAPRLDGLEKDEKK